MMKLLGTKKKQPVLMLPMAPAGDLHEQIAKRAYELFEAGGSLDGTDRDHWLEAERDILEGKYQAA